MSLPPVPGTVDGTGDRRVDGVLAIARAILSVPGLAADDELTGNGATSLSIVRIILETRLVLHLEINPADLDGVLTVRNLARAATPDPPT